MSITTQPLASANGMSVAVPTEPIWRLTVDQYHEMVRAGILTEDDPVELLEGWLVVKMPKIPAHRLTTQLTRQKLESVVPAGWYVDSQEPITIDGNEPTSEPEPDVTVVRGDRRQYHDRHPGPGDVVLLVEVSEATLQRDRGPKKRIYAAASVPVYWIVNLLERQVEVYTDPSGPANEPDYRQRQDYGPSDQVPVVVEGREVGRVAVSELLP